jgi:hypothetical protein
MVLLRNLYSLAWSLDERFARPFVNDLECIPDVVLLYDDVVGCESHGLDVLKHN